MSARGDNRFDRLRLARAVAIVVAVILAVPGADAAMRLFGSPESTAGNTAGIDSRALLGEGDAFAALERIEESVDADSAGLPTAFMDEIGCLRGAHGIRAHGDVVGYLVSSARDDALASLASDMEAKGWIGVPLGDGGGATFVKTGGRYGWVLATCTEVGTETSVVIRCMSS